MLSLTEVVYIHDQLINTHGGTPGVRDAGMIESALYRPQSGYYSDVVEQAAALWESLTMNHGFYDGNKRVGFACTEIFLYEKELEITATQQEIITFIESHLSLNVFNKENLEEWLRTNTAPVGFSSSK